MEKLVDLFEGIVESGYIEDYNTTDEVIAYADSDGTEITESEAAKILNNITKYNKEIDNVNNSNDYYNMFHSDLIED